MKINKHIEIVRSGTPRLSSMGLKSCTMICDVLGKYYKQVGITYVNTQNDLDLLIDKKPDLVFLGFKNMHSADKDAQESNDIWICEQLDNNGINYTGSRKAAMILDHNKDAAKRVILDAGLLTAPYFKAKPHEYTSVKDLPLDFPLFIKPPHEGGGIGIDNESIVRDLHSFNKKVDDIERDFGTSALVEKYLVGREFSVALMETDNLSGFLAMPIELISQPNKDGDRILTREVKSEDTETVIAVEVGPLRKDLNHLAIDAFKALGARDYGRIDIRMDEEDNLHFMEANLIPGLALHDFTSYFTSACWLNQAMNYDTMILSVVELGLAHSTEHSEDSLDSIATPDNLAISLEAV